MGESKPPKATGKADATETKTVLAPEAIQSQEAKTTASLPPADRQEVERSAGEGMVGTPVEAATMPTYHIEGPVDLQTLDGQSIGTVQADLQIMPPAWAGTLSVPLSVPANGAPLTIPGPYQLRLADGRRLSVMVTARTGDLYTVEGIDPITHDA